MERAGLHGCVGIGCRGLTQQDACGDEVSQLLAACAVLKQVASPQVAVVMGDAVVGSRNLSSLHMPEQCPELLPAPGHHFGGRPLISQMAVGWIAHGWRSEGVGYIV